MLHRATARPLVALRQGSWSPPAEPRPDALCPGPEGSDSATRLPPTCWSGARTSERSRSC